MEMISLLAADIKCGTGSGAFTIPGAVVGIIQTIVFIIQVVVPILLIIWGMLDFAKSVIGGDEDAIKKSRKIFVQRLIAAIIVFLVITITQLVVTTVGGIGGKGNNANSAWSCAARLLGK